MKKLIVLKSIPAFVFSFITIMLIGMTIAANELYAWVPQGYCYGTGCYLSGKRPGNFYQAAFSYDDTLVGFIFMMINILLVLAGLIVWIIIMIKRNTKRSAFTFLAVFGAVFFTTGLVMSIFVAACNYIDDSAGMIVCGFLGTFAALGFIPYGIIARKKAIDDPEVIHVYSCEPEPSENNNPASEAKPSGWTCPNCGAECEDKFKFCMKCGAKKPE